MAGTSSPLRRVAPHLLGPPLPPVSALWAANGRRALSAACCVGVPLALGLALGHPGPGSAAALGGFTAVYGHALPYRRRAGVAAGVALAVVASIALGGLTGGHPVLLAATLGLIAAAATAGTAVWRVGPPGALPPVLVAGSASALGSGAEVVGQHVAAAAAAAVLSWVVVMLPWLWDPAGPERRALQAADAAVTRAEADGAPGQHGTVARAVRVAVTAAAGGSRRRPSLLPAAADVEARFSRALPLVGPATPHTGAPAPTVRPRAPLWTETAARIGIGVGLAGLVAAAAGLPSPYWAATSAVAVLLGTDARHTRARAFHRVTGTLAGTAVAALVFAVQPPTAVTVVLVAVLLICVELLIASQYVLAVTCLTPVSLLLVHLGAPGTPESTLIAARIEETVLGMAVALAVGLLLFPRAGSRRLPHAVTATADCVVAAVRVPAGTPADRALHDELVALTDVAIAARAELFSARGADAWLERSREVADLGWALLGARAREDDVLAEAVAVRVRRDLGQSSMTSRP
ncbi:FUSC family protein [Modestobacter sp. VKM Ac-2986]|uniref:FUSC family protein n=1 Tax=Modestobacter sp. VKM Ac-2986 TaxID=3004140 RepID=UPI0022AB2FB7|nr:FUSC family protein [Modestobacter sp. VKM Ac-2986]MCZ2828718.1 FUSC family protein [Modestobacter sp. VKM Ac-2986]